MKTTEEWAHTIISDVLLRSNEGKMIDLLRDIIKQIQTETKQDVYRSIAEAREVDTNP